ncbi:MAG: hypothetical protein AAFY88_31710, partial [Acidobacteriota bacterium]
MSQPVDDRLAIDTIRFLAVDMVEQANSGHPGAPLGQAPLAHMLFTRQLRFDATDPADAIIELVYALGAEYRA